MLGGMPELDRVDAQASAVLLRKLQTSLARSRMGSTAASRGASDSEVDKDDVALVGRLGVAAQHVALVLPEGV